MKNTGLNQVVQAILDTAEKLGKGEPAQTRASNTGM